MSAEELEQEDGPDVAGSPLETETPGTEDTTADPADDDEDAEQIEGDDDDLDRPADQNDDAQPEPQSSLTYAMELEKNRDRVTKYLASNKDSMTGEDSEMYVECPCCRAYGTPGYVIPGNIPEEIVPVLHQWLGMRTAEELRPDEHRRRCDKCNGEGVVATGSKVLGQSELPCITCTGKGWIGLTPEANAGYVAPINGLAPAPTPPGEPVVTASMPTDTPEVAELRSKGYTVLPPVTITAG